MTKAPTARTNQAKAMRRCPTSRRRAKERPADHPEQRRARNIPAIPPIEGRLTEDGRRGRQKELIAMTTSEVMIADLSGRWPKKTSAGTIRNPPPTPRKPVNPPTMNPVREHRSPARIAPRNREACHDGAAQHQGRDHNHEPGEKQHEERGRNHVSELCASQRADDSRQAEKRRGFHMDKAGARVHERRRQAGPADDRQRHADRMLRRHARGVNEHRHGNDRTTAAEHG